MVLKPEFGIHGEFKGIIGKQFSNDSLLNQKLHRVKRNKSSMKQGLFELPRSESVGVISES